MGKVGRFAGVQWFSPWRNLFLVRNGTFNNEDFIEIQTRISLKIQEPHTTFSAEILRLV
jgi:hypothetical protein